MLSFMTATLYVERSILLSAFCTHIQKESKPVSELIQEIMFMLLALTELPITADSLLTADFLLTLGFLLTFRLHLASSSF